ncbi:MAG: deacetylase, partial [Firmicutes bacterium]|nr:deacetylase [Bacillota bacterium]
DWKDITAEQVVERVTRYVEPGSIVLFHNNAEHVEEYLPKVLQILTEQGYEIVPVGELIYQENYQMDHTGKQIPKQ